MNSFFVNPKNKSLLIGLIGISILLIAIDLLFNSFALIEPVSSINFTSQKLNYEEMEPGSYKVEKSAKWISYEKARITFQVDTVLKTKNKNRDIILVLDVSGSMISDKLNRVKEDTKDLIDVLLSNPENKAALITFDTTSSILSEFTSNKELLIDKINALGANGTTNYYQALINVENLLQNYTKEADKDLVTLFLTDGYPNENTPNEIAQYDYLKEEYPYLTIQGVQYEMGSDILEPIKKVSDNQFIADITSLNNVLLDASVVPNTYDSFTLTDYIDMDNFKVENENDIKVSMGKVTFDEEEQKITWTIDNLKTGSKPSMTIDVIQKEETSDKELLPTNIKESVESKLDSVIENIESDKTPVLKGRYQVIYEGNAPSGCSVSNLSEIRSYHVFDTVEIDSNQPICEGYQFKGWKIVTTGIDRINQEYFSMPESDVIIRAEWSSMSISKTMDGEVYVYMPTPSTLREVEKYDCNDIWGYNESITKVVFQDEINDIAEAIETYDISAEQNGGVMGYIVPNTDNTSTYTAYIQGYGKIIANQYSGRLFSSFNVLVEIEGLEYLDTSNVEDMSHMFQYCSSLTSLDLSHFDTSNVINMGSMFVGASSLASLDLSHFDTSKVTNMSYMFSGCSGLKSLNVSHFDTSSVIDISKMFDSCSNLVSLDVSHFDTSSVTYMSNMFDSCSNLVSLDVSNFDTSKVTNMSTMFYRCTSLTSLDLSHFDTSKVTNMNYMFTNCAKLNTVISINNPNINNYKDMFKNAATDNAQIIVDYIDSTSDLVDKMIATKSENSNVIKRQNYNAAEIEYSNELYTTCNNVSCALDELYNIFGGNQ